VHNIGYNYTRLRRMGALQKKAVESSSTECKECSGGRAFERVSHSFRPDRTWLHGVAKSNR